MKFSGKYKRELEKKIDNLMIFTNVFEFRYAKKDLIVLGIVGVMLLGFAIYTCYKIMLKDDNTNYERILDIMMLAGIVWEFAYFGAGMLYTKTKKDCFRGLYVVLGYLGLIMGSFIAAWITLLEIFAKRVNIYHLYKYFYAVTLVLSYTVIMVMALWKGIVWLEKWLPNMFALVNWSFGIWILCYILFRISFGICLKIWFKFLNIDSQMVKVVFDEMQILLYMLLIILMIIIWGVADADFSKNIWVIGFLNASTVVVLMGSVRDKIGGLDVVICEK